ncbi:MAG TPA: DinB family protein [Polyangiaceae bacterium]|nr:DinB family protein [Polyangiaceae bacterium]
MTEHAVIADTKQGARFEDLPKLIVRRQLNRSGNRLVAAIEPLKEDEFFQGGPSGISVAWTVGHLACVSDLFAAALDDGKLAFSPEAHTVFNDLEVGDHKFATRAEAVDRQRFPKAKIIAMMRQGQIRLLKVLDVFDVRRWDEPSPDRIADTLPTLGSLWEHLAVHTYWHMGELSSAVERFYGTHTMNSMLHYFAWGENDTDAARRAASDLVRPSRVVAKNLAAG